MSQTSLQQASDYLVHEKGTSDLLSLIYDRLENTIYNCALEDRLELKDVSYITDQLATLYKLGVKLNSHDEELINKIIDVINMRLMKNPAFIFYLHDLNASLEGRYGLSDNKIAAMIKNSAFLVSVEELWEFAQLVQTIKNRTESRLNKRRFYALLKKFDTDAHKTILQLWENKVHLISTHHFLEFKSQEESERKKHANEKRKVQRNFEILIAALEVTDEYKSLLKILVFDQHKDKLYELFEDAYSGEKETLSLGAYAMNIAKNKREEVASHDS